MKNDFTVVCPKCGKDGFPSIRWVQSSYYPKITSVRIILLEELEKKLVKDDSNENLEIERYKKANRISGNKYRGKSNLDVHGEIEGWQHIKDRSGYYKVRNKKHYRLYIGHYDSKKYFQQMNHYKAGNRKSRPNGRRWCLIPKQTLVILVKRKDGTGTKLVKLSDLVNRLAKMKLRAEIPKKDTAD